MLLLISLVNLHYRKPVSSDQKLFDSWVNEIRETFYDSPEDDSVRASISAIAIAADGSIIWRLDANPEQVNGSRLIRILNLVSEARLFSTSELAGPEPGQLQVQIKISSGERRFETRINQPELTKNIRATTMLALLREYSEQSRKEVHSGL